MSDQSYSIMPQHFSNPEAGKNWLPFVEPVDTKHIMPMFINGIKEVNDLQLIDISGRDALSQLGEATITFDYPDAALNSATLLRTKVGVLYHTKGKVKHDEEYQKAFTGIIWDLHKPSAQYDNPRDNKTYYRYQARIVPKFYLLQYHVDSRIFVGKTVEQILKAILIDEHKLTDDDFTLKLEGIATTFKIPVCIQYHESDWAFIQRLLMKTGIYFYLEHGVEKGNIKHIMHFTDQKPQKVAKEPLPESLKAPHYYAVNQSYANEQKNWVGCYGWRAVDCAMMSAVAVDGFYALNPTQALMSQQKLAPLGAEITKHPNFGHYRPQQGHSTEPEGKAFAEIVLNQYQAFQTQAQLSFNVPGFSVMQKFSVNADAQGFKNAAFGIVDGDYLVFETTFKINLLGNAQGYAAPEFTVRVIPLTGSTPAPCPYFNLPTPPVTQTKLFAVVSDDKGGYDDAAINQSTRVMNNDKMRGLYVAFPQWDQQKRTNKKENLTPVPTQYFAPPGLSALPMVGTWCLVEFLAFDQTPIFIGVQHDKNFQPYSEKGPNEELVLMAQSAKGSDNEHVNRIVLNDGSKIDPDMKKQNMSIYAPGSFELKAAQGSKDAKAGISINTEGKSVFGNDKASIVIDEQGNIIIDAKGDFIVKVKGNFTVNATEGAAEIKAAQNILLDAQGQFNAKGATGIDLDSQSYFQAKSAGAAAIMSDADINLVAGGVVNAA